MTKILLFLTFFIIVSCNNPYAKKREKSEILSKNVNSGDTNIYELPDELGEISGITFLNDSVVLSVADEEGILYYYNLNQKVIVKKQNFGKPDDYEDLVKVGNDLYIAVSNGLVYQISNFDSKNPVTRSFKTPLKGKNNIEGIAYDSKNNRLLLAAKDNGLDNNENTKEIYSYDLNSGKFQLSPAFTVDISQIEVQFKGDKLEESSKKLLKALGNENMNKIFRPSALTVKSATQEIFILSSINNLIAVISPQGKLSHIIPLKGKDFRQPEGIAFAPDGSLYVSNEGRGGVGNIIKLKHEK